MTEWLLANIYNLLPTIETFRPVGYLFVFIFSVLESLAFAGLFVPGTLFIIFVGFLTASDTLAFWPAVGLAALGAALGDGLSFYFGRHSGRWFHDDNRWFKKSYIDQSQKFFFRYGAKSVFFGRFIGPIRPIIPFVAGLSRMSRATFFLYNITSAFVWAIFHITIGYYLGQLSLAFTGNLAKRFELAFLIIGLVIATAFTWWSLRHRPDLAKSWYKFLLTVCDRFFARNPKRRARLTLGLGILILLFFLVVGSGFILSILNNGSVIRLDDKILNFFGVGSSGWLNYLFISITQFGNGWVLVALGLFLGLILFRFNRLVARVLVLGLVATGLLAHFGKILIGRGRPPVGLLDEPGFSFPSGHAAGSLFLYGFLTFLAWRYLKKPLWRRVVLIILPALILLIGFSRLYLGVHFLSDVIGGYILGSITLLFALALSS